MGVGNLLIGENQGGAQVFAPNPAIQQYVQMLQQRQAKRESENKYLNDQMAQVKPDGLRNDADRSNFFNQYAKVKQDAIDAENERDPMKKAMAIAGVRQRLTDLNSYTDQSKQQAAKEKLFNTTYMANPSAFSDEAVAAHRKSYDAAVDSPDVIKDYTTLARQIDPNKIEQEQRAVEQGLLKNTQWNNPVISDANVAGRKAAFIQNNRVVDPQHLYEDAMHRFDAKGDFEHYIKQSYPDIFTQNNPVAAKALAVKQYIDSRGPVAEYSKPVEKIAPIPPQPDRFYDHYNYQLAHPRDGGESTKLLPTQALGAQMMNGNLNAGEQFLNYAPLTQFKKGEKPLIKNVNGYHIITVPDQVSPDTKAIKTNAEAKSEYLKDPEKSDKTLGLFGGKPVPYEQSEYYKDNPPLEEYKIIPNGNSQSYTLDPNNPIDYNAQLAEIARRLKIPVNEINKQVGGKASRGNNAAIEEKLKQTPQPARKTIKRTEINSKASAAGYSAEEYTNLLKQKGVKIED